MLARHVADSAGSRTYNENIVGGDIAGGSHGGRSCSLRPRPASTPTDADPRLFLCSASTPPGGGVHGMCGYNAAKGAVVPHALQRSARWRTEPYPEPAVGIRVVLAEDNTLLREGMRSCSSAPTTSSWSARPPTAPPSRR